MRLIEIPPVTYEQARQEFHPGDAWFFYRRGLRDTRGIRDFGGWLSNQAIAFVTRFGGDHRGYHNLIHVETLAPFTPNGTRRWFTVGFTADADGIQQRLASAVVMRYPAPILWVPVLDTRRAGLTAENIWREVELAGGDRYAAGYLLDTASKSFRGRQPKGEHFCSDWVVDVYAKHAVIPHLEYHCDRGKLYCSQIVGTKWSPKEMLASLCCWDWERARLIGG